MHNIISLRLTEAFMISSRVKHFILKDESSTAMHWQPGQFITIHFEKDGKPIKRSYSLANAKNESNTLEFAAGYVEAGPGTEYLFHLKPGDIVNVTGPFGRLILKEDMPKRYILAATSTGVTPYRAMLPALKQRLEENAALSVVILQGVQYKDDLLYDKDFRTFAEIFRERVSFIPCFSRENAENLATGEHGGYIQHVFPALKLNATEDCIYLCGNPGMIDEAFQYLQEQGFTVQQIIREKYISR